MKAYLYVGFAYGNITNVNRKAMLLPKSYKNDAAAIASFICLLWRAIA